MKYESKKNISKSNLNKDFKTLEGKLNLGEKKVEKFYDLQTIKKSL